METIILPVIFGKGKTGTAQTGEYRALIKDTHHYPNAFTNFRALIGKLEQQHPGPFLDGRSMDLHVLGTVKKEGAHIQEMEFSGTDTRVIFVNLHQFQRAEFTHLKSVHLDNLEIFV